LAFVMLTTAGDTRATMSAHPLIDTDRSGAAVMAGAIAADTSDGVPARAPTPLSAATPIAKTAILST
jgi:hypothetical protein